MHLQNKKKRRNFISCDAVQIQIYFVRNLNWTIARVDTKLHFSKIRNYENVIWVYTPSYFARYFQDHNIFLFDWQRCIYFVKSHISLFYHASVISQRTIFSIGKVYTGICTMNLIYLYDLPTAEQIIIIHLSCILFVCSANHEFIYNFFDQ